MLEPFQRIPVISSVHRSRRWSVTEMIWLVGEAMQGCGERFLRGKARRYFSLSMSLPGSAACSRVVMPTSPASLVGLIASRRCRSLGPVAPDHRPAANLSLLVGDGMLSRQRR